MSDTTEAAAPTGAVDEDVVPQTAQEDGQLTEQQDPVQDEDATQDETTPEAEEAEEVEINLGGNKELVKLPKAVAEKLNGYTASLQTEFQRNQEAVAREREAVTERGKLVDIMSSLDQAGTDLLAQSTRLNTDFEQLRRIDIDTLWSSNPDEARRVSDMTARVQAQLADTLTRLSEHQRQRQAAQAEHHAAVVAKVEKEGREKVAKAIPGWNSKAEAELMEYAVKAYGVAPDDAKTWPQNPVATMAMWKAMQWDRMQQRAAKAATPTPPPATPSAPVRPKAAPSAKNPDSMSMDEYVRWRNQQTQSERR